MYSREIKEKCSIIQNFEYFEKSSFNAFQINQNSEYVNSAVRLINLYIKTFGSLTGNSGEYPNELEISIKFHSII